MPLRLVLGMLSVLATLSAARADTLTLLIWESYIDQTVLEAWSARTGVAVRQQIYDSTDARDEVLANPESDVDLIVVGENGARLFGRRGILERLSSARIPSASDYTPEWRDRCAGFGLPYLWGTMGILYRSDKVATAPTSWSDLMKPAPALKGHVAMFDDHNETFVPSLILLGKSINATDTATLRQAFELLKAQAPSVRTYDYVMTSTQNADYGSEIHMALGYSGDQHVLNGRPNSPGTWRYVVPQEGSLFWLDCMAVAAASPRKALALDLLDHIASAPSALANAKALTMPTANQTALEAIAPEVRADPSIYPPAAVLERSQSQEELTVEAVQTRRRIINTLANFRDAQ